MRVNMAVVPLELGKNQHELSLRLPRHAVIRSLVWTAKPKLVMGAGQPEFSEIPCAFIELDPDDQELLPRTYVLLATGVTLEPREGYLARWCATGMSLDGQRVVHLFEVEAVS